MKWPKKHFQCTKMRSRGDFSQFQGGNQVYKSDLRFSFRTPEMPFLVPQKPQKLPKFAILGLPKMAFPVSETKIRDHFYKPHYPPKPRKITSETHFCTLKVVFRLFHYFGIFLSRFQSVKTPKTKSVDLPRKMTSNQKNQENKPALKFYFTQEQPHYDFLSPSPTV